MGPQPGAPDLARDVAASIVERVAPERIILFGSHARGDAGADSDLDLLVVLDTAEPPAEACLRVRRAARERHRGLSLDVLVYTPDELDARLAAGDPLLRHVLREGKVLYAR